MLGGSRRRGGVQRNPFCRRSVLEEILRVGIRQILAAAVWSPRMSWCARVSSMGMAGGRVVRNGSHAEREW
jgi:hypothetical protein